MDNYFQELEEVVGKHRFAYNPYTSWGLAGIELQSRLFEHLTYTCLVNGVVQAIWAHETSRRFYSFQLVPDPLQDPLNAVPIAMWLDELRWAAIACGDGPRFAQDAVKFTRRQK